VFRTRIEQPTTDAIRHNEIILARKGTTPYSPIEQISNATPKANTMPLPTSLPAAIVETVLIRLAALFLAGAGGDTAAARHTAAQMLGAYHPQTTGELRLAANIVIFSFQALDALGQAAAPDMPLTRILRLRSGAVSLSRESAKAERRLGQIQKTRQLAVPAREAEIQPEPAQPEPKIDKAVSLIRDTATVAAAAKASNLTWTQAYEQRQRATRIAASLERARVRIATLANAAIQAVPDHHSRTTAQPGA
jgi:hypothetical protein